MRGGAGRGDACGGAACAIASEGDGGAEADGAETTGAAGTGATASAGCPAPPTAGSHRPAPKVRATTTTDASTHDKPKTCGQDKVACTGRSLSLRASAIHCAVCSTCQFAAAVDCICTALQGHHGVEQVQGVGHRRRQGDAHVLVLSCRGRRAGPTAAGVALDHGRCGRVCHRPAATTAPPSQRQSAHQRTADEPPRGGAATDDAGTAHLSHAHRLNPSRGEPVAEPPGGGGRAGAGRAGHIDQVGGGVPQPLALAGEPLQGDVLGGVVAPDQNVGRIHIPAWQRNLQIWAHPLHLHLLGGHQGDDVRQLVAGGLRGVQHQGLALDARAGCDEVNFLGFPLLDNLQRELGIHEEEERAVRLAMQPRILTRDLRPLLCFGFRTRKNVPANRSRADTPRSRRAPPLRAPAHPRRGSRTTS